MSTHPFMSPMPGSTNTGASSSSAKTIGALNIPDSEMIQYIKDYLIPVEFKHPVTGQLFNFRVSLGQLILAVSRVDLGIDRVDNTSDLEKPVSDPVRSLLDKTYNTDTKIPIEDVNGLVDVLENYRLRNVPIDITEIADLIYVLSNKASINHTHEQRDMVWISELLSQYAPANHSHSLSNLEGWSIFIQDLTTTLSNRTTPQQVAQIVDQRAVLVGLDEWE